MICKSISVDAGWYSVGYNGHTQDECCSIITQSQIDGQLIHGNCMPIQSVITMDGAPARWKQRIYLNMHGHTLQSVGLSPLQTC